MMPASFAQFGRLQRGRGHIIRYEIGAPLVGSNTTISNRMRNSRPVVVEVLAKML
jgi:hypothetical protein